ncbi:MAG: radical SAM protein [Symploca sp. SIO3E6]|nr:radical SAM protein [Caldora sp. SIO3E6]
MTKPTYEGYCDGKKPTYRVREKYEGTNIYVQNAKSLLTKASGFIKGYDFSLNPYRGCQYGCSYCYATAFSPNSQMRQDWGNWVIIKENAPELLKKELIRWYKKNPDRPPRIYMSTVTDPYQPIEAKERLTRSLLEVMQEYPVILVIQTRSPLITKDIPQLQRIQHLRVNLTIPTGSEQVRKDFEPRSPSIKARLNAVKLIRESIDDTKGFVPKISITITPTLPTPVAEQEAFIKQLNIADRIVIQEFHASSRGSLVASTRPEALALKQKYSWWYDNEQENYQQFKDKLTSLLPGIEIREGKAGFSYD